MEKVEQLIGFKNINKLAIPAIFAGIAEPFLSLTDLAIIGQVEQDPVEVLGAVGVVGSFISAIIWILAQAKTAISTTVSQYSNPEKSIHAKKLFPQLVLVNLVVCFLILMFTIPFANQLFELYNLGGKTLDYSVSYYQIRAFGIPITLLTFSMFGVFRGLQNTLWAMIISISGGVLNLILNIFLIHGLGDIIPAMHIEGAAWASLIAQLFMFFSALWFLYMKTDFRWKLQLPFHPELKRLLLFSLNLFIRTLALNIVIYLTNRYAASEGDLTLATHTIMLNIWLFTCFFIDGYANAANAISGKLIALNREDMHHPLWKRIVKLSFLLGLITSSSIFFFDDWIAQNFSEKSEVINFFVSVSMYLILLQFLNAFTFSLDGMGKGMGKGKELRNTLLIATFFVFLPLLITLRYYDLGFHAIWIAFLFWMFARGGILYRYLFLAKK
ncbi:MAG: MATE family efflux transporter [Flavobacteriales bacterium]|jgi:putative MATE family efflux protein|nr:MATE family efflux transporter [Flavobacteriales bacterium]